MESKRSPKVDASGFHDQGPRPSAVNFTQKISGEDSDILDPNCNSCTKHMDLNNRWYHSPGCSVLVNKVKRLQIRMMAANVKSQKQFRQIILDVEPRLRRGVYDLIAPLLVHVVAPSFKSIISSRGPRG